MPAHCGGVDAAGKGEDARLDRFLHAAAQVDLRQPPAQVRTSALAAFDEWARARAATRRAESPLRRFVATLSFDGFAGPAVAGARGATAAPELLTFNSEVFEILCHVLGPDSDTWTFEGQVLAVEEVDSPAPVEVEIRREDQLVATVSVDEFGEFSVTGLPRGAYTLVVRDDRCEVIVGPVAVPATPPIEATR